MEKLWFYYVLSCITTSHGIAVMWFLRVYWLLPLSIVDAFGKHRRLFCWAPMNTWASQSTSFPKGVFSLFQWTLFLFINWNCRQLGRSHTESTDTVYKTLQSFLLTKRSCQTWRTREFCWAIPGYEFAFLDDGHQWNEVSPLASALQERKRQRDLLYPSPYLKIYWFNIRNRSPEKYPNLCGWKIEAAP